MTIRRAVYIAAMISVPLVALFASVGNHIHGA
jgi:Flp pilus assembly pilin Flp